MLGGKSSGFDIFNRKWKDIIFSFNQNILQQKKFGLGIDRVSPDKMCGEV